LRKKFLFLHSIWKLCDTQLGFGGEGPINKGTVNHGIIQLCQTKVGFTCIYAKGAGRVPVLSPQFLTPLLNIFPYPYPIPDGFEFIVSSPYPSGIGYLQPRSTHHLKKYFFCKKILKI